MFGSSPQLVCQGLSVTPGDAVLRDGSLGLSANWDAGSFQIRAETFYSDVTTGTAPLTVASTTVVTNLNADMVDGIHASSFLQSSDLDALQAKASVKAATTANITLSGEQTIDGVSCTAGDRVLVWKQSTATENGIYVVVASGSWTRATDLAAADSAAAVFLHTEQGTVYGDLKFLCTNNSGSDVVGTDNLTFTFAPPVVAADEFRFPTLYENGNSGTNFTILGSNGTFQSVVLSDNATLTISPGTTLTGYKSNIIFLLVQQDGTGSRTLAWDAGVQWPGGTAPTASSGANQIDAYLFMHDGTNVWGISWGLNYS